MPTAPYGAHPNVEYSEFGNILNLALAVKDDHDQYFVVAAWLETHDTVIRELLWCVFACGCFCLLGDACATRPLIPVPTLT